MSAFCTSRRFDVSPQAVFAAIRDPARLARWWGPDGFSNSFETFEFRPGGRWCFTMHGPDGTNYPNECVFVEVVPNALVRMNHVLAPLFTLTITLTDEGRGTRLDREQAFDDPTVAEQVRHIVVLANEQNLDRLGRELARSDTSGT